MNSYSWLPFGEKAGFSETVVNPFTFAGQFGVMDDGSGLYFMRNRWYDPAVGRFTRPDPLGIAAGDSNSYRYVSNDPVNHIDPLGAWSAYEKVRTQYFMMMQGLSHEETVQATQVLDNVDNTLKEAGWQSYHFTPWYKSGSCVGASEVRSARISGVLPKGWEVSSYTYNSHLHTYNIVSYKAPNGYTYYFHVDTYMTFTPDIRFLGLMPPAGSYKKTENPTYYGIQPPPGAKFAARVKKTKVPTSHDPNAKLTVGHGEEGYIAGGVPIDYTIHFENMPSATAPAQHIVVTDQLDGSLDWSTLELGEIGFNNVTLTVPPGLQSYAGEATVSTDPNPVRVQASLDPATGIVTWTLDSIDPVTGGVPKDPFAGFLPPNDETHRGDGFVTFTILPKTGLADGTTITNQARIVFDVNDPIDTNIVTNTIDTGDPASSVASLPATTGTASFLVSWTGSDAGGSGSTYYDVYVSTDGGPFTLWLAATTETSATFDGAAGHSYGFFSVATDNVGNRQATPREAQATTTVGGSSGAPSVTTSAVSNISTATADGGGNVVADGGSAVTERGVCWSTSSNPTTADAHTSNGMGTGVFSCGLTGLTPNTLYHVRAFATNAAGTAYGGDVTFTTRGLPQEVTTPTVTTAAIAFISATSATGGGEVTADGGAAVTARGVCWSTSPEPTIADAHTSDGTGTGVFTSAITGLTPNTVFNVRAYATNSAGTAYGETVTFTTTATPPNLCFFPHVAAAGGWETEIGIINDSNQAMAGLLKVYSALGALLSGGEPIALAPHARREIVIGQAFANPGSIAYAILETDNSDVKAYAKFSLQGSDRVAVPAVKAVNSGDIFITHIASTPDWWTGIALLNTTSASKSLTIEFDSGDIIPLELAANEHRAFSISELFGGEEQPELHTAVVKNAAGVIGLEVYGGKNGNAEIAAILLTDKTANSLYYPHLAINAGWWTGVVAYNPYASATNVTITPFKADGTALSAQAGVIEGHEQYIGSAANLDFPAGTAWFEIEASSPITGFELLGTGNGRQLAAYSSMDVCPKAGVFAKKEKQGWTGIAFVNLGEQSALVELTAYADDGSVIGSATLTLAAHARLVDEASDLFAGQDISEATYIGYSSTEEIAGFQLDGSSDGSMLDGLPGM